MPSQVYLSYSAINDFLRCPGLYSWKYQFRSASGCRIDLTNPYLVLGIVFESVRKKLSEEKPEFRTLSFALTEYERKFQMWYKAFGFQNSAQEQVVKDRGVEIIKRFFNQPKFVINQNLGGFLKVPFNNQANVFLCGSTDWVEENSDGSLTIVDFKTGTREESENSLQLPIYKYLVEQTFKKPVSRTFYWYLDREDYPREVFLNSYESNIEKLLGYGKQLLDAIINQRCQCKGGKDFCPDCGNFEKIKTGQASLAYTEYSNKGVPKKEYYQIGSISS